VTVVPIGPNIWEFTCASGSSHVEPYRWQTTAAKERLDDVLLTGKSEELGLYDDLPACLAAGEPWVEYGVVEYRYSKRRPTTYERLLRDYGHTRIAHKPYTASAFIAAALGRLSDAGVVALQFGPATGYWSYNGTISYWALPPAPPTDALISWKDWATAAGLDPDH
jgi:hypothetical protein